MPPRRKKCKHLGAELPISVPVRFGGRVVANVIVMSDESVTAEWSADLNMIPWAKGERERLAYNAAKVAEAMNQDVCITQDQVYAALWPNGGKSSCG